MARIEQELAPRSGLMRRGLACVNPWVQLDFTANLPLTPTLSPSEGARGKTKHCRPSSLAPSEGERVGVRGAGRWW
jgi:hypothetical protein